MTAVILLATIYEHVIKIYQFSLSCFMAFFGGGSGSFSFVVYAPKWISYIDSRVQQVKRTVTKPNDPA